VALDLWPDAARPLRVGQYIPQDILARVDFEVPAPRLLEEQRQQARNSTPATFALNTALLDQIMADLSALPGAVAAASRPADLPENIQKQYQLTDQTAWEAWRATTQPDQQADYAQQLQKLRSQLEQTGVVRPDEKAAQLVRNAPQAWLVYPQGRKSAHVLYELAGLDEQEEMAQRVAMITRVMGPSLRPQVQHYLINVFANNQPLYRYRADITQQDIDQRLRAIDAEPPTQRYQAGQRLAPASRQEGQEIAPLSQAQYDLLRQEQRAYHQWLRETQPWQWWLGGLGRAMMLGLLTVLLSVQVVRHQPALVRDHWRGLAMTVLLLVSLLLARLMVYVLGWNAPSIVLAVMMAAMVVAIAYEQRFAFMIGAIVSLVAVFLVRWDLLLLLVLLGAVASAVFQLREIRTRSKLVEVSAASAVVVFALVLAGGWARQEPWMFTLADGLWGAGFAALVGFLIRACCR
jgi:membrane-associated HD superfamily phosphohydrolase